MIFSLKTTILINHHLTKIAKEVENKKRGLILRNTPLPLLYRNWQRQTWAGLVKICHRHIILKVLINLINSHSKQY